MGARRQRSVAVLLAFALMILASLVSAPLAGAASGSISRWHVFSGPLDDEVVDMAVSSDGSVYLAGSTRTDGESANVLVMRNTAANAPVWYREWDNPGAHGLDVASAVAVDRLGNVIVAGSTASLTDGDNDYLVLKYSKSGTLLWQRIYDGGEHGDDEATDLVLDSDGNAYVTGSRHLAATGYDFWTLKLRAADGSIAWQHGYDGLGRGELSPAICIDSARNVYVAGESGALPYSSDIATVKISSDGTTAWALRTSGPQPTGDDWGASIALGQSGALFVAATAPGEDNQAIMLLRLTTGGTLKWRRTYDSSLNWHDVAEDLRVDKYNNAWVVGRMYSSSRTSSKGLISKWNSSGRRVWTRQWTSPGGKPAEFRAMALDRNGTAWCAGFMKSTSGDLEALMVKYATDGRGIWSKAWEGPARRDDVFNSCVLQGTSSLFAGGYSLGRTSVNDAAVVKYQR